MGIPLAQLSTLLNLAGQSHADSMAVNNLLNHNEVVGAPGFTGVTPSDRASYYGYDVYSSPGETINNDASPENCLAFWTDTIYHRQPIINYSTTIVGFGSNPQGKCAMNYGTRGVADVPGQLITTWPANNQQNVPITYTVDAPDPRLADPSTLGYVISLKVDQPQAVTQGTDNIPFTATLTDATGKNINVFTLTRENDPNSSLHDIDHFVMIPKQVLAPNMTYTPASTLTCSGGWYHGNR